ncbi:MAG: hypothetical protein IKX76_01555 [Eubacterium sp.]|nr:hypothetical protein [Eubacterium sp.]
MSNTEKNRFGHLRAKMGNKPSVYAPPVHFYHCGKCGNLLQAMSFTSKAPVCCDLEMEELIPRSAEDFEDLTLDYQIIGSFNENAVKFTWSGKNMKEKPVWIWLGTYSGGILRFIKQAYPPVVFGLSGDDAYAYCDKDPCEECRFRCKKGFVAYFYFEDRGLISLPLERSSMKKPKASEYVSKVTGNVTNVDVDLSYVPHRERRRY